MSDSSQLPAFVRRGLPGPGHQAMSPLIGEFDCHFLGYIAGGTAEQPLVSALRTDRTLIAHGHHVRDETYGGDYYRTGILSYSTMDERFEWVTHDAVNTMAMVYLGRRGSGPTFPADLRGSFTDQGVLSDDNAGNCIQARTVITIADHDHHTLDIYMTAAGQAEILADRKIFTRRAA